MKEYTLRAWGQEFILNNNSDKFDRATKEIGDNASPEALLGVYDRLGGLILDKNRNRIQDGLFWERSKQWEEDRAKYIKFLEETTSSKQEKLKDMGELRLVNLDHLRSFSGNLLSINIGLIGAIAAVYISNSANILNHRCILWGLILLLTNTVLLIFYSAIVLVEENRKLVDRYEFIEKTFNEIIELAHEFAIETKSFLVFDQTYLSKIKQFAKQEKDKMHSDAKNSWSANWLYLFSALSFIGLILVFFGIIN